MSKHLAIIPARGGSKRLPRKNVIDFFGQPMISYTIAAAVETGLFDKIIVSTEDDEIAAISEQYGAEISRRPADLATDTSQVKDVCLQLLAEEAAMGRGYETFCCLYATAPLRSAEDIRQTMLPVLEGKADGGMAVSEYTSSPYQALREVKGMLEPIFPEYHLLQSQKLDKPVVSNGSTYAMRVDTFLSERTFYCKKLAGYVMPRLRAVDIDDEEELEIAKLFFGALAGSDAE